MCIRKLLIARYLKGEGSVASLARDLGIHRSTAHIWIRQYITGGYDGLKPTPRHPHHSPRRTEDWLVASIIRLQQMYPRWGARKLMHLLETEGVEPPSERTVNRILKRNGLVKKLERRTESLSRFERCSPNELWQMDHKRSLHLGYGERVVPFVVVDDATRFLIGVDLNPDKGLESTWSSLWSFFGAYGLPEAILSDNAHLFAGHDGPSQMEVRLIRLGIKVLHGRVGHPQTQGKVERLNGTLEYELFSLRHWRCVNELKPALVDWINTYNFLRPHEALDMAVPGSNYLPSRRPRPDEVPSMAYPENTTTRVVGSDGRITYRGARYEVGRGLVGEKVSVRESDMLLEISYGHLLITKCGIRPKRFH
jgi:transposase InsO family protein